MNYFEFENKKYPYRELNLNDFGNVVVSTDALNKVLMNDEGAYTSKNAMFLDEGVFFFVDENDIILPTNQLRTVINKRL